MGLVVEKGLFYYMFYPPPRVKVEMLATDVEDGEEKKEVGGQREEEKNANPSLPAKKRAQGVCL